MLPFDGLGMEGHQDRGVIRGKIEARFDCRFEYVDSFRYTEIQQVGLPVSIGWPEGWLTRRQVL